jgi:ketosteroid isomerase-like protein
MAFSQTKMGEKSNKSVSEENLIRRFVDDFSAAAKSNDVAALDAMLAPDFLQITAAGAILTKEQRLATERAGDIKIESSSQDEEVIRIYGDTAVVTARTTAKGAVRGNRIDGQYRVTMVLIRKNGQWRIVTLHQTVIPPPRT